MIFAWYVATRLYSFVHYGSRAFGYDTGIYRHFINGYFERFFDSTIVPFGFSGYTTSLRFLGAGTDTILFGGYIILSLAMAGLLYCIVLEYTEKKISAWFATTLFSISIVQYEFFWGYYYRNFLALFFTLIIFYLIQIRSRLLWLPLAALSIAHPLTALPVGISLCLYAWCKKEERKFILISGLLAGVVAIVLQYKEFLVYLPFITNYFGAATVAVAAGNTDATGLFMSGKNFLYAILWYAPLAIFTLITAQWKKYVLPITFLFVNTGLVLAQVVFYRRFLVSIDLILIILAAVGLTTIWEWPQKYSKTLVVLFLLVFGIYFTSHMVRTEPLLTKNEMVTIAELKLPENARILTINPYYAPWLYGFTNYGIIAPGMFEYDTWNREKWDLFRGQINTALQTEMLQEYQTQPLYIFLGERDAYFEFMLEQNQKIKKVNEYLWQVL